MITKEYIKVGNRIRCIMEESDQYSCKGTIISYNIAHNRLYVNFEVEWDNFPENYKSYNEQYYSWFDEEHGNAPKKHYRRATKKDFKDQKWVRCRSKRKKGYWKGETGILYFDANKKYNIKKFVIFWYNSKKRNKKPETWTDFTKNFEIFVPIKKKSNKKRTMLIDTTLPILQAGHLQDRFIRRAK